MTLEDALARVEAELPGSVHRVTKFPSGAVDVEVRYRHDVWVVQKGSSGEIGVSLLVESDDSAGHDRIFSDWPGVVCYLVDRARLHT